MGYSMDQIAVRILIPQEKQEQALAALQSHIADGTRYLTFCQEDYLADATTLANALAACRYETAKNEAGDIIDVSFIGEKFGDDDVIWRLLAPSMRIGDFIAFRGEDNEVWRWRATADHTISEDPAHLVWDNDGTTLAA
jgi:hypothetical protein